MVLSFLDAKGISRVFSTCRSFRTIVRSPYVWDVLEQNMKGTLFFGVQSEADTAELRVKRLYKVQESLQRENTSSEPISTCYLQGRCCFVNSCPDWDNVEVFVRLTDLRSNTPAIIWQGFLPRSQFMPFSTQRGFRFSIRGRIYDQMQWGPIKEYLKADADLRCRFPVPTSVRDLPSLLKQIQECINQLKVTVISVDKFLNTSLILSTKGYSDFSLSTSELVIGILMTPVTPASFDPINHGSTRRKICAGMEEGNSHYPFVIVITQ